MSRQFTKVTSDTVLAVSALFDNLSEVTLSAWLYMFSDPIDTEFNYYTGLVKNPLITINGFYVGTGGASSSDSRRLNGYWAASVTNAASVTDANDIPLNAWTHVAMTYSRSGDRKVHLYINGVERTYLTQTPSVGDVVDDSSAGLYIGNDSFEGSFDGDMDTARIFNVALSASQVAQLFAGTLSSPTPIGAWNLCGTQSPEPDSSGNGNDGVVTGTTLGPNSPDSPCPPRQVRYYHGSSPSPGGNVIGTTISYKKSDVDVFTPPAPIIVPQSGENLSWRKSSKIRWLLSPSGSISNLRYFCGTPATGIKHYARIVVAYTGATSSDESGISGFTNTQGNKDAHDEDNHSSSSPLIVNSGTVLVSPNTGEGAQNFVESQLGVLSTYVGGPGLTPAFAITYRFIET